MISAISLELLDQPASLVRYRAVKNTNMNKYINGKMSNAIGSDLGLVFAIKIKPAR